MIELDPGAVFGCVIGVLFLTVVNLVAIAFSYGRVTQKVEGLDKRVARVEKILNHQVKEGV